MSELVQEINLYQPIFRRQHVSFGLRSMAIIVATTLSGLVLVSGYAVYQHSLLEQVVVVLEERKAAVRGSLAEMGRNAPSTEPDAALLLREKALIEAQHDARTLITRLDGAAPERRGGFTHYLTGLARQPVDGLWLRSLEIGPNGSNLALGGETVRPELVLKFLRTLRNEEVFAGHEFATAVVKRAAGGEQGPTLHQFELRSKESEDDDAG